MKVGFLDEKEGHHSSRRLLMMLCAATAMALVAAGIVYRDMAFAGAGTGLWATLLPIMTWNKAVEKGGKTAGTPTA